MAVEKIHVPNIGDFDAVEVVEILVNLGDVVAEEDSLITIESDKASMEIPSPMSGTISSITVSVGDTIKQEDLILELDSGAATSAEPTPVVEESAEPVAEIEEAVEPAPVVQESPPSPAAAVSSGKIETITVPDIGDFDAVEVIEVLVAALSLIHI